ncbi:hypothetical protein [Georgenia thermotolerans]|uniref:Uncharacterized protein n=1 Tax=Georgenia thermotolerans TaxID=527326 RepID=A0A7J5ULH6_9MICO|nr:hypothetical protein [Georgenia thermotolerans]KAE8763215.1 hypothetical protein GB883_15305 [Georgenia thermotolerans]
MSGADWAGLVVAVASGVLVHWLGQGLWDALAARGKARASAAGADRRARRDQVADLESALARALADRDDERAEKEKAEAARDRALARCRALEDYAHRLREGCPGTPPPWPTTLLRV